jgi:hypothetical protein
MTLRLTLRKALSPNDYVRQGAQAYNRSAGLPPIVEGHNVKVDENRARRIADAYDAMPSVGTDPETHQAYSALGREIQAQWDHAPRGMGIHFEPWTQEGQPYNNSQEMMQDVGQNRHLYFFTGGEPHPFLGAPGPDGLSLNDKFRAVHDLFGHAAEGYQFGPRGEENAWLKHSQMFSPQAQRAMTSETRGQNSWVNFGRHNYHPQTGEYLNVPAPERPYAEQKAVLLPPEFSDWQSVLRGAQAPQPSPSMPTAAAGGTPQPMQRGFALVFRKA